MVHGEIVDGIEKSELYQFGRFPDGRIDKGERVDLVVANSISSVTWQYKFYMLSADLS